MNDAIKTISLDDVADIQAQNDKVGAKGGALGGNPKMTVPVATRFGETRNNGYLGTNTNLQFIKVYRPRFYSSALSRFSEILGERFNTPLKKRMAAALVGLSLAVTLVFSLSTDEARQSSLEELSKFLNTVL
ncbi:MAG: hypothetical protein NTX25_16990, partial [Proteobacteria bacterium]|nr:hypothetical protein [Pseudomonadota bacterium]